jgi:3-oxoacyl-[acyl-carrier protein] reductase
MTNNKTAIVTGAGQGIGKGIALTLAKEGYNIVVSDINLEEATKVATEITGLGVQSLALKCDVSLKTDVDAMVASTIETFGTVNVLVNNAGIYPFKPFEQLSEADWDKVIDVNLKGTYLTNQSASKVMSEGGKIVNISSIASVVGFESLVPYCASKGGINGFTRALALELASKKINVNVVAPGAIETPGAQMPNDDLKNQTIAGIPWKRMGQPEDIANAVVFLASEKADYITGQVIIVDGGYTLR